MRGKENITTNESQKEIHISCNGYELFSSVKTYGKLLRRVKQESGEYFYYDSEDKEAGNDL